MTVCQVVDIEPLFITRHSKLPVWRLRNTKHTCHVVFLITLADFQAKEIGSSRAGLQAGYVVGANRPGERFYVNFFLQSNSVAVAGTQQVLSSISSISSQLPLCSCLVNSVPACSGVMNAG